MTKRPLLVYVHIPFCTSKCHFCDWVQEIPAQALRLSATSNPRIRYMQAVSRQIAHYGSLLGDDYAPAILYWGGGTASILSEDEICFVMEALRASFDLSNLVEATIESSPETLDPPKLALFRELGFNRISVGVQSMNDGRLRAIGRSHDAQTASESVWHAKEEGFENINIDLISGFPGESIAEFEASVRSALSLPVNHVSLYPFRPAAGTAMRIQSTRGLGAKIDLTEQLAAYRLGKRLLEQRGLQEYAVSHFGSPECLSDLAYFQLQMDWAGIGSGATSLLNGEFLCTRRGQLEHYSENPLEIDDRFPAFSAAIANRLMYQSLSTREGAESRHWAERTGVPLAEVLAQPEIRALLRELSRGAALIRDERGVRLRADQAAESFIRLLFSSAPRSGRRAQGAQELLGVY